MSNCGIQNTKQRNFMFSFSRLLIISLFLIATAIITTATFFQKTTITCGHNNGDFAISTFNGKAVLSSTSSEPTLVAAINGLQKSEITLTKGNLISFPINLFSEVTFSSKKTIYTAVREPVILTEKYITAGTFLLSCLITLSAYLVNILRKFLQESSRFYLEYSDKLVELESAKRRRTESEIKSDDEISKEEDCFATIKLIDEIGEKHLTSIFADSLKEKIKSYTEICIEQSLTKNQRHADVRKILQSRVGFFTIILGK